MTSDERTELEHRDAPAVYLLHFDTPYKHARHYLGQTQDLHLRLADHRTGKTHAARLIQVILDAGLTFTLARVWECGTWAEARALERQLKRQKHGPRLCPICKEKL
jgi:predicted GIY-YIG superfamily endonuclease